VLYDCIEIPDATGHVVLRPFEKTHYQKWRLGSRSNSVQTLDFFAAIQIEVAFNFIGSEHAEISKINPAKERIRIRPAAIWLPERTLLPTPRCGQDVYCMCGHGPTRGATPTFEA
jgi:hypothetical protein